MLAFVPIPSSFIGVLPTYLPNFPPEAQQLAVMSYICAFRCHYHSSALGLNRLCQQFYGTFRFGFLVLNLSGGVRVRVPLQADASLVDLLISRDTATLKVALMPVKQT